MEKNKAKLSEDFLRKFKYRTEYLISETPKYRPLVTSNEEFDEVPILTNEAGEQEDAEKPEGKIPPAPSNDVPQDVQTPSPAFDAGGAPPPEGGEVPAPDAPIDPMGDPMGGPQAADAGMGMPPANPMGAPESPENEVNDIQNEIIKHNIEAMKGIHDQLASLDSTIQGLNAKMDVLNADVEEVREPTSGEKLMNKTDVSYPYYFNLNDLWHDNWFEQKREGEQNKGVREMPDGSYVADFDDLPQKSKIDVQDSFNNMV